MHQTRKGRVDRHQGAQINVSTKQGGQAYFSSLYQMFSALIFADKYLYSPVQKYECLESKDFLEHMNVREKIIHDTKAGRSHLAQTWLDLGNVYGSISLAFIKVAIRKNLFLKRFNHILASISAFCVYFHG